MLMTSEMVSDLGVSINRAMQISLPQTKKP